MPAGFPARRHVRHWRTALMAALIAFALFHAAAVLAAETKSVENLEQTFAREKDARKRARLALEILDLRLDAVRAFVATGTMIEADNTVLPAYDAALSRLEQAVNTATHVGTSKRVEVGLRRHMKDLEQVRMNVSSTERPLVEAVAARVEKVREAVLYSIMAPKPKK